VLCKSQLLICHDYDFELEAHSIKLNCGQQVQIYLNRSLLDLKIAMIFIAWMFYLIVVFLICLN